MIPKARALVVIAFVVAGIPLTLTSDSQAWSASDKAEIAARFQSLIAGYSHGDVKRGAGSLFRRSGRDLLRRHYSFPSQQSSIEERP